MDNPNPHVPSRQPPKMSLVEGHELLRKAGFEQGPSAGSRGECWIRTRDGHPAYVVYAGPPWGDYFLAEAIHDTIALD